GGIGGERGASIARGIFVDRADSSLDQVIDHDRCATVLERPGRHLRFELEQYLDPVRSTPDERGPALAERDAWRPLPRTRSGIAPQGGLTGADLAAFEPAPRPEIERAAAIAAPARPINGVLAAAGRAPIGRAPHPFDS